MYHDGMIEKLEINLKMKLFICLHLSSIIDVVRLFKGTNCYKYKYSKIITIF